MELSTFWKLSSGLIAGISSAYYLIWLFKGLRKRWPGLWRWLKALFHVQDRPVRAAGEPPARWPWGRWIKEFFKFRPAMDITRDALHSRLSNSLVHTTAQTLTVLRLGILVAVAWRWARMRWQPLHWQPDLVLEVGADWPLVLTVVLAVSCGLYVIYVHRGRRHAEQVQVQMDEQARHTPAQAPGSLWSHKLPDVFFSPALVDVLFLTVVFICLPGQMSDVHLGFIVPMAAAWLFLAEGRIVCLFLVITVSMLAQWYWSGVLETGVQWWPFVPLAPGPGQNPQDLWNWKHTLFGHTLPRVFFWACVTGLVVIMRRVRRNADEQAHFFSKLAEAMPFKVFVKDRDRHFVYANAKLMKDLCEVAGKDGLNLAVEKLTDEKLGIDPVKAALYARVDQAILNGGDDWNNYEPSYLAGSTDLIETIKVGVRDSQDRVVYVLGLCRDPKADMDLWFFLNMVDTDRRHCFFRKTGGVFTWVNDQFYVDAGKTSKADVLGQTDAVLYEPHCALAYSADDAAVLKGAKIERDEWHEPKGRPLRRVHVAKQPARDSAGTPVGVRGYFFDIHQNYLIQASTEQLLALHLGSNEVSELLRQLWQTISPGPAAHPPDSFQSIQRGLDLIRRMLRLLNLRQHELLSLRGPGAAGTLPTCGDLRWASRPHDPVEVLHWIKSFMETLLGSPGLIHFDLWPDHNIKAHVDEAWLQAAAAGLWFYSAARCEKYLPQPAIPRIDTSLRFEINADTKARWLVLEVTDPVDRPEAATSVELLAAEVDPTGETICMGLQIVLRIALLHPGTRVTFGLRADGQPGRCFKVYFPQP